MRRIASTVAAVALAVATLVACSAGGDDQDAPPASIGLTPGPGVSILSRPTGSPTATPKRDEPGDGNPPIVYGDCVIETSRQTTGILERITYGEASCAEAVKKKPAAWQVVNMSERADCPDDNRHITFTIGPLLSTSIDDTTFVCAEQL